MAVSAAATTFVRTFSDPGGMERRGEYESRATHYRHLWQMYENAKFENTAQWQRYKADHNLYRYIRNIYNPTRRLVDFYAGIIYPGVLTTDARRLPDNSRIAIPLAEDTDPALVEAVGQLWQWSNWRAGSSLMVRYGACLGDVFVEIVDDIEGGTVRMEVVWPGLVTDLDLDAVGNVKAYAIEYDAQTPEGENYTYRREVGQDVIRTYRDDSPAEYDGHPAEYPNPYGFAPAVWIPHTYTGGDHGHPAMRNIGKFDEANNVWSAANDHLMRALNAPTVVAGGGNMAPLAGAGKQGSSGDLSGSEQEKLKLLQAPLGAEIHQLSPTGVEETLMNIDRLIREIEDDHPELTMYKQLRDMAHVTGPGAERMLGDAATYIQDARSNYDTHSAKLFQMAVAVGGFRANSGAWGRQLSSQQRSFLPFRLDSYRRGELDLDILPRPIIPETPRERIERERMEWALDNDRRQSRGDGEQAAGIEARIAAMAGA